MRIGLFYEPLYNVAHLAEGLYFVEIQLSNDEKITKKIIVSRE